MSKYGHLPHNWFEAIVNKLGGEEAANSFLRGELSVSEWREKDGVIYFSVTSDGTSGEDWINRLEGNGPCVSEHARLMLRSTYFKPTSGVRTEVAVFKGTLFANDDLISKKIRTKANKRKFGTPNAELACLICAKFTEKDMKAMGLRSILTMHEPIADFDHGPGLLCSFYGYGGYWLDTYNGSPDHAWDRDDGHGFAFVVSSSPR